MAHQRWSERGRDRHRRCDRARRLALGLTPLLLLLACDSGESPVGPEAPAADRPDVGIITDLPSPADLVGEWTRDEKLDVDGAHLRRTTTWRFDSSGTCRLIVAFFPAAGLAPEVNESVCAYVAHGRTITLRFPGLTGDERIRWGLDGRHILILDGERYLRTSG